MDAYVNDANGSQIPNNKPGTQREFKDKEINHAISLVLVQNLRLKFLSASQTLLAKHVANPSNTNMLSLK